MRLGRYRNIAFVRIGRLEIAARVLWWPSIGIGLLGETTCFSADNDHGGSLRPALQLAIGVVGITDGIVHEECFGWCRQEHA